MNTMIVWDHAEVDCQGVILCDGVDVGVIVQTEDTYQVIDVLGCICYEGCNEQQAIWAAAQHADVLTSL